MTVQLLQLICSDYRARYGSQPRPTPRCLAQLLWRAVADSPFQATVLVRLSVATNGPFRTIIRSWLMRRYGIDVPATGVQIGAGLRLPHPANIVIGDGVRIGSHVTLYQGITLGSHHGGYPTLQDHVTIWPQAVVAGAVVIGSGAQVSALAFIRSDVPAHTTGR